jgi:hypothetical protein
MPNTARRRCDGATVQRCDLEIVVGRNHRHPVFRNHRVFAESGDPASIELLALPLVRSGTGLNALARTPVQHNGIARLDVHDAGADLDDLGRSFMPEQMRQKLIRTLDRLDLVDLRPADRRIENLDQHLPRVQRVRKGDVVNDQRLARFGENRGLGGLDLHYLLARSYSK